MFKYMSLRNFFSLKPHTPIDEIELPVDDHIHQWENRFVTYAPPRRDLTGVQTQNEDILTKAMFGVTTILQECLLCRRTRRTEMLGSDNPQLDDILDKVELYGPQYLQRTGITYTIQRYQQPIQQGGALPLR